MSICSWRVNKFYGILMLSREETKRTGTKWRKLCWNSSIVQLSDCFHLHISMSQKMLSVNKFQGHRRSLRTSSYLMDKRVHCSIWFHQQSRQLTFRRLIICINHSKQLMQSRAYLLTSTRKLSGKSWQKTWEGNLPRLLKLALSLEKSI